MPKDISLVPCRRCGLAGRLERTPSRNAFEHALKPYLPVRRFTCQDCNADQIHWVGFRYHSYKPEYPLWLVLFLIVLSFLMGWCVGAT